MVKRKAQVVHREDGRIELYSNANRRLPINLGHVLADGSRLTDAVNAKLFETIEGVINALQTRIGGVSYSSIIGPLFILVQWMFVRKLYSFGSLQAHHFEQFLVDSAKGIDTVIEATPRLYRHLQTLADMPESQRRCLRINQLFTTAGIPPSYAPRLPRAKNLARDFIKHGVQSFTSVPLDAEVVPLASTSIMGRTRAIQMLWTYRDFLADPVRLPPFALSALSLARKLGEPKRQTEIVPHALAIKLFVGSMEVVMTLGPLFLDWDAARRSSDEVQEKLQFEKLRAAVERISGLRLVRCVRDRAEKRIAAITIERLIVPMACQVVVLAYTGRRKVEVETLQSDCIVGDESEGRHLKAYIAKRQSFESRPCPEIVARAIQLMNRYHGYDPSQANPVFNLRGKLAPMRLAGQFDKLAAFVGGASYTDRHGNTTRWHWKAHQFRRLYAIYYIWRYEDSSLIALRHYFGHGSEREAAYYARLASDDNFSELVQEAGLFTLEKLRDISRGDTSVAGAFAQVVRKRIERARIVLRLSGPGGLERVLNHLVKEEGLVIQAGPWGFCGCKPTASNLRRAQCQKRERASGARHPVFNTPVPETSTEETCASCHFHATDSSRRGHWSSVLTRLDLAIEGGVPNSLTVQRLQLRREKVHAAAERFFGGSFASGQTSEQ